MDGLVIDALPDRHGFLSQVPERTQQFRNAR
jgi:hypothetical protein